MKNDKSAWPILIVSNLFSEKNDEGYRLDQLTERLKCEYDCRCIESLCYDDALKISGARADLGAIIIDWDMPVSESGIGAKELLNEIRSKNLYIPIFLLTDRMKAACLDSEILNKLSATLWKTSDTIEFLAGNVEKYLSKYIKTLYSPFFGALVKYAEEYKYAWHTPGHMGGTGFLRTPSGTAFFKFFGESIFRNDISVSVPELGSLLDHSGVTGDAEKNSARVFGADKTYYVLNGTSNVNQIIWRSRVLPDDIVFVDRNCHKSINYAMVITASYPVYMIPRRNKMGIIGPVRLKEFDANFIRNKIKKSKLILPEIKCRNVKMSSLTNSTYDGVCYNVAKIKYNLCACVDNLHFDEAWFAYAKFHPIYAGHFGMSADAKKKNRPPIFVSQSTHKLLTAFSQCSMLHIKNGSDEKIDDTEFNESYMMHSSTSPQYNMVAALDVATQMMDEAGEQVWGETISLAVDFRKEMVKIKRELEGKGEWFFGMWQPEFVKIGERKVPFENVDTSFLANNQQPWAMSKDDNWHGFDALEDDYAMLDPIKLTITTPAFNVEGKKKEFGIPAKVVTKFLTNLGIVCEKTDFYSFLMLNSLGTNQAKQESLMMALMKFKKLYDANAPLCEALAELVASYPQRYAKAGLKEHACQIHNFITKRDMLAKMQAAYETLPEQVIKPSQAYTELVAKNVQSVPLSEIDNKISAVMIAPYPPGIPVIMGGEIFDKKARRIIEYLRLLEDFENEFPGYESTIHGIERFQNGGRTCFKTLCLKNGIAR